MKRIKYLQHLIIVVVLLASTTCEDIQIGDEFLSQTPESVGLPEDSIWSSQANAEKVLITSYNSIFYPHMIRHGYSRGISCKTEYTDIAHRRSNISAALVYVYPGTLDATSGTYYFPYAIHREEAFEGIRYAYLFLENVDDVPDFPANIKTIRKGEARVLIARWYYDILRNIGTIPKIEGSYGLDFPDEFPKMSVEEHVNFIVDLCDQAATELPWYHPSESDYLRFNKASALALKLKTLVFAARPLFNSNTPYHPECDETTWYGNYDVGRWDRAVAAGQEFMNELNANGYYRLIQPQGNTHYDYREAFAEGYCERNMGEGKTETLMPIFPVHHRGYRHDAYPEIQRGRRWASPFFTEWLRHNAILTKKFHDQFQFLDGTEFPEDFDWENPPYNPWFDAAGNPTRDPRLYETIRINGDYYQDRILEVWQENDEYPRGRDAGSNRPDLRMRKWVRERDDRTFYGRAQQYSYIRLPEVYLLYAEAINEANGGPNATAEDMINRVRNRVGMPDVPNGLNQEDFRDWLMREYNLEFAYEEVPWFNMTFWKQEERFTTPLTSINIFKTDAPGIGWYYKVVDLEPRAWWTDWNTKWYLWPWPQFEIDKGVGITQNPGW